MIAFLVRAAVRMLLLSAVLYGSFFVPLGRYTLYGHLSRIAGTDEARELGGEVTEVVEQASTGVSARVAQLAENTGD